MRNGRSGHRERYLNMSLWKCVVALLTNAKVTVIILKNILTLQKSELTTAIADIKFTMVDFMFQLMYSFGTYFLNAGCRSTSGAIYDKLIVSTALRADRNTQSSKLTGSTRQIGNNLIIVPPSEQFSFIVFIGIEQIVAFQASVVFIVLLLLLPVVRQIFALFCVAVELRKRSDWMLAVFWSEGAVELHLRFFVLGAFKRFRTPKRTPVSLTHIALDIAIALEAVIFLAHAFAAVGFFGDVVTNRALILLVFLVHLDIGRRFEGLHMQNTFIQLRSISQDILQFNLLFLVNSILYKYNVSFKAIRLKNFFIQAKVTQIVELIRLIPELIMHHLQGYFILLCEQAALKVFF